MTEHNAGRALAAEISAAFTALLAWLRSWARASDETTARFPTNGAPHPEPDPEREWLAAADAGIRQLYPPHMIDLVALQQRAATHRVKLDASKPIHVLAALVDGLDHPDRPSLLQPMNLTWASPIIAPGEDPAAHPAALALARHLDAWHVRHYPWLTRDGRYDPSLDTIEVQMRDRDGDAVTEVHVISGSTEAQYKTARRRLETQIGAGRTPTPAVVKRLPGSSGPA